MSLEDEQVQLLLDLIDAALAVERSDRRFFLSRTFGGDHVEGPGGTRKVLAEDIYDLIKAGLLVRRSSQVGGHTEFTIAPEAFRYAEEVGSLNPVDRVEDEIFRRYMDDSGFGTRYPTAYQRWQEAANLLWGSSAREELTTIGHKTREAVQEFASALVVQLGVAQDVSPDPAHTVNRLRGAVNANRERLGDARRELLDALIVYWGEVIDLIQRQEHGGQKEGEPLSWEDGRRAVFHTLIVMYEIDKTLVVQVAS